MRDELKRDFKKEMVGVQGFEPWNGGIKIR